MKVVCLKSRNLAKGIEAFALTETDVPIATVARDRMVNIDEAIRKEDAGRFPVPRRFRIRQGGDATDATEDFRGYLVYRRRRDMVEFLLKRYVPLRNSPLDEILRDTEADNARERVMELLIQGETEVPYQLSYVRTRRDSILKRSEISNMDLHYDPANGHLYKTTEARLTLRADTREAYREYQVPRRIVAAGWGEKTEGWSWFDGRETGWSDSVEDLPEKLARQLDESGRPDTELIIDSIPQVPMEPLFLIKFPSRSEARTLIQDGAHKKSTPPFPNPLYMIDSLYPMPLPEGLPVVDDPRQALAALGRISDTIYLPQEVPGPRPRLTNEPRWRVACRIRA